MHIRIAKNYELKYWRAHKDDVCHRSQKMVDLFKLTDSFEIMADVGCGPRGGIFYSYEAPVMYAVDPLWGDYKKEGLIKADPAVHIIKGEAETFNLPSLADGIISVNSLDHSGSLEKSIRNIAVNLSPGGKFFFHMHIRTKKQLNKGHQMLIREDEIDEIFSTWKLLDKRIFAECPIENKPYKTYVATVEKEV